MKSWPVREAKARFSELLNACEREGPQVVTRRGEETAVLLPVEEWRRLTASLPSLKALLLAPQARCDDLPLPKPGEGKHRASPDF